MQLQCFWTDIIVDNKNVVDNIVDGDDFVVGVVYKRQ